MLLRKQNTLSTREYDSGGFGDYAFYKTGALQARSPTTLSPPLRRPSPTRRPSPPKRLAAPPLPPRYTNQLLANTLVLLSVPLMLAAYSLSNYNQLHPVETVFAKFLVQAALQIGVTLWKKERVMALRAKNYKGLVVRGIFAACNAFVLVLAQLYLPPTTVYTLTSTGIIFTYLCTYLYSHSKFTRIQTISFLMGALGITTAIIAQTAWPLLNPHYHFHSNFPYNELNAIQQLIGCLVLVVWMGVWACSLLFGQNQLNSDPNQTILIHSVVGFFIFSIAYLIAGIPRNLLSFASVAFPSALMLAASNYLFTWGIHISAKRTITTLLNHATLPVSYLISIFAFGENPSWLTAVGSLLTLGSVTTLLTQ